MCISRVILLVFLAVLGGGAAARSQTTQPTQPQQTPRPTTTPTPTPIPPPGSTTRPGSESAEEMLRQMLQPQGETAQPLRPSDGAPPPPPADVDDPESALADAPPAPTQPLIPEGTPLLDRVGRLTPSADGGGMAFTLESDGRALAHPPLLLLPNRKLSQLEDRLRTSYRDLKVSVSGEITEYRGRNYLLLTRWTVVNDVVQPLR